MRNNERHQVLSVTRLLNILQVGYLLLFGRWGGAKGWVEDLRNEDRLVPLNDYECTQNTSRWLIQKAEEYISDENANKNTTSNLHRPILDNARRFCAFNDFIYSQQNKRRNSFFNVFAKIDHQAIKCGISQYTDNTLIASPTNAITFMLVPIPSDSSCDDEPYSAVGLLIDARKESMRDKGEVNDFSSQEFLEGISKWFAQQHIHQNDFKLCPVKDAGSLLIKPCKLNYTGCHNSLDRMKKLITLLEKTRVGDLPLDQCKLRDSNLKEHRLMAKSQANMLHCRLKDIEANNQALLPYEPRRHIFS